MQLDYFFFYTEANIVCIVILAILLVHDRFHSTRQEKQIWFDRTVIAHILYFISDIGWAAVISGNLPRSRGLVILFNFLNFILLSLNSSGWFMYMAASEGMETSRLHLAACSTVSNKVRSPSWMYWPMEWRSVVLLTLAGKIPLPSLPSLSP